MKIALLAYDYVRLGFLFGLKDLFERKGCTVKCFTHHGDPKAVVEHTAHPWGDFRFEKIEEFNPDRIIMFNGFATETLPATLVLREKFSVFHVEQGWLPQRGNIYIDHMGTGARSDISKKAYEISLNDGNDFEKGAVIGALKQYYKISQEYAPPSSRPYVVVPLQLEHDTSIIYDSEIFKTMNSLVSFVRKSLKGLDLDIYVKAHPRDKDKRVPAAEGLHFLREGSLNDIIGHEQCKGVIGINSTSLIEALVHEKPVVCLGMNVASGTMSYVLEYGDKANSALNFMETMAESLKDKTLFSKVSVYEALFGLSKLQFSKTKVPDWVYNYVETETFHSEWLL